MNTKRNLILMGLMLSSIPVLADYQKGSQSVSLHLGGAGFNNNLDINQGDNRLKSDGGLVGIQYLYFIRSGPTLGVGLDLSAATIKDDHESSLVPGSRSEAESHVGIYQAVVKLAYPSGRFRPYVLGGLGGSRSVLQSHIAAGPTLYDSSRWGFSGVMGIGFDFFMGERFFLGTELRQTVISQLRHDPTPDGLALGSKPVRDPGGIGSLLLRVGYKFGAK